MVAFHLFSDPGSRRHLTPRAGATPWDKAVKDTRGKVYRANKEVERKIDDSVARSSADSAAGPTVPVRSSDCNFLPGQKTVFADDLNARTPGGKPPRWTEKSGDFRITSFESDSWIATNGSGVIAPDLGQTGVPERYTIEMEFFDPGSMAPGCRWRLVWVDGQSQSLGWLQVDGREGTLVQLMSTSLADRSFEAPLERGIHALSVTADTDFITCCLDGQRVARLSRPEGFQPSGFEIQVYLEAFTKAGPALFHHFRIAERDVP